MKYETVVVEFVRSPRVTQNQVEGDQEEQKREADPLWEPHGITAGLPSEFRWRRSFALVPHAAHIRKEAQTGCQQNCDRQRGPCDRGVPRDGRSRRMEPWREVSLRPAARDTATWQDLQSPAPIGHEFCDRSVEANREETSNWAPPANGGNHRLASDRRNGWDGKAPGVHRTSRKPTTGGSCPGLSPRRLHLVQLQGRLLPPGRRRSPWSRCHDTPIHASRCES